MSDKLMRFDPATGEERPYPSHAAQWRVWHGGTAWLFNPWTGSKRHASDVGSDPYGHLIVPEGEPLKAAPEPATVAAAARGELEIDLVISPKGGVSADFSSDKTCRAFAEQISKFKGFDPQPSTVSVDAGALAELRESMAKFRALPESAVLRPAGVVARERVMEAARRLLAGVSDG